MGDFLILLFVRSGIPVALLFLAGYLAQRYRRRLDEAFQTLPWVASERSGYRATTDHPRSTTPCWEVKQCPLAERDRCPAYVRTYMPCWLARKLAAGGHLESACLGCVLYQPERAFEGLAPLVEPVGGISRRATAAEGS